MNDSEFDKEHGQRGRTEREVERSVPCTAVRQLSQACAEAICNGQGVLTMRPVEDGGWEDRFITQDEVAERLERTLYANHETMCEATRANA